MSSCTAGVISPAPHTRRGEKVKYMGYRAYAQSLDSISPLSPHKQAVIRVDSLGVAEMVCMGHQETWTSESCTHGLG